MPINFLIDSLKSDFSKGAGLDFGHPGYVAAGYVKKKMSNVKA